LPDPECWRGRKVYDHKGVKTIREYFRDRPRWSRVH
jgi:hypothetical protein